MWKPRLTGIRITWELLTNADSHPHPTPTQTLYREPGISILTSSQGNLSQRKYENHCSLHPYTRSLFISIQPVTKWKGNNIWTKLWRPQMCSLIRYWGEVGELPSQRRCVPNHAVHFKYLTIFFVNYTSAKLRKIREKSYGTPKVEKPDTSCRVIAMRHDDNELPTEKYWRGERGGKSVTSLITLF